MQTIKFYVEASQTLGTVRDNLNVKNAVAPTLIRGCGITLKMRVFAGVSGTEPYPLGLLHGVSSWRFVMDRDFDENTRPLLENDQGAITVASVSERIDGINQNYTEFTIPISAMNTVELSEWLGAAKSKSGLNAELAGYDENNMEVFVLQIENFTVRNRIISLGNPTELPPEYLNSMQVKAYIQEEVKNEVSGATPYIGENGHWFIDETDTGVNAQGERGADGTMVFADLTIEQRNSLKGESGQPGIDGQDGTTPHIGENNHWFIGEQDTGVNAQGQNGSDGVNGQDGITPHIGENNHWFIGEQDTGVNAQGQNGSDGTNGQNGITPHIGENNHWFIGDTDTGVNAQGQDGATEDNAIIELHTQQIADLNEALAQINAFMEDF